MTNDSNWTVSHFLELKLTQSERQKCHSKSMLYKYECILKWTINEVEHEERTHMHTNQYSDLSLWKQITIIAFTTKSTSKYT